MIGPLVFIGGLGSSELMLILLVFVVLFGAHKIPELAKSLGKGIREFKKAAKDIKEELGDEPDAKKDL